MVFSDSVHADHEDHGRRRVGDRDVDRRIIPTAASSATSGIRSHPRPFQFTLANRFSKFTDDLVGGLHAHIGADQVRLDLIDQIVIEPTAGEQRPESRPQNRTWCGRAPAGPHPPPS